MTCITCRSSLDDSPGDRVASLSAPSNLQQESPSRQDLQARLRIDQSDLAVGQLLGKGSFKAVYRGRWNNTNVAIVSMRKGGLVTEARLMQRISTHPNLVQFYRWAIDGRGNELMVMELVKQGPLDKMLLKHGSKIRTRVRLAMCEQICSAMCQLASEGVMHRDLAARNILVSSMEPVHVKVSDFGLAKVSHDDEGSKFSTFTSPEGACPIPVRWSAPEVLTRREWSEKSDVWSFGVSMWEIFSNGSEPYAAKSDQETYDAITRGEVLSHPAKCPKDMYQLMLRCWSYDPADRPTFEEVAQVFKSWRQAYIQARCGKGLTQAAVPQLG